MNGAAIARAASGPVSTVSVDVASRGTLRLLVFLDPEFCSTPSFPRQRGEAITAESGDGASDDSVARHFNAADQRRQFFIRCAAFDFGFGCQLDSVAERWNGDVHHVIRNRIVATAEGCQSPCRLH